MNYNSPNNDLDEKEICELLNNIQELSIPMAVKYIWKKGFEWGYELGDEDGYDRGYEYGQADAGVKNDE